MNTAQELSKPEIYQNDHIVSAIARYLANEMFEELGRGRCTRGELKAEFMSGKYPELVAKQQRENLQAELDRLSKIREYKKAVAKLTHPLLTIEVSGEMMKITPSTWDGGDLAKRLSRKNADWQRDGKFWLLPLSEIVGLERVLKNWDKAREKKAQSEADAQAQKQREANERQAHRERRYQAEREARKRQYTADRKAQEKAKSERVKVTVGEHAIGDILDGKRITGFGQSCFEKDAGDWGRKGVRYDESCVCCHKVTVIDNDTELCEKCGATGESIRVQYAYFS